MDVLIYENPTGEQTISRTGSYLAWKSWFREHNAIMKATFDEGDICNRCGGDMVLMNTKQYGDIRCICSIMKEQQYLHIELSPYRSLYERKDMDSFDIWGTIQSKELLTKIVDLFYIWTEWPKQWLLFTGGVGIGKTHVLTCMAEEFKPWSLYITAGDLENHVFRAMDRDELPLMINAIQRAPFLFIDDLGMEYGSDFIKSNLRKIIDFRYLLPQEYITVVATNLNLHDLRRYDMRIADRLMDQDNSVVVDIGETIQSWRTSHGRT